MPAGVRDQTARRTQFIPAHDSHLAVGLLLAFVHDLEGVVWFRAIILGTHSVRRMLARRSVRGGIDGVTGPR